jgi:hypothetical protein
MRSYQFFFGNVKGIENGSQVLGSTFSRAKAKQKKQNKNLKFW